MSDYTKTISGIIDKASNAFISYCDDEGFPITKAMLMPRVREGVKTFYLTTNTSSNKIKYFEKNNKASLYFIDKRFYRGVSLIGTVEVLYDKETKQSIWQDGDEMYYPLGVDDPDYCVIKFTASRCRYYANFKNKDFEI